MEEKNYKLIKLKEGYIIVFNEGSNTGDWTIFPNTTDGKIENFDNCQVVKAKYNYASNGVYNFKVIASTFIPELPNIDFNNLEEEFGIVDIENNYYKELEERREIAKNFQGQVAGKHPEHFSNQEIHHMVKGYLEGFNKCLQLNKDKLYTLYDMYTLLDECKTNAMLSRNLNFMESRGKSFIQSLQPKTEWNIDIEMAFEGEENACKDKCEFGQCHSIAECKYVNEQIMHPKITNNSVKIINIII